MVGIAKKTWVGIQIFFCEDEVNDKVHDKVHHKVHDKVHDNVRDKVKKKIFVSSTNMTCFAFVWPVENASNGTK